MDIETKNTLMEIVQQRWRESKAPVFYSQIPGLLKQRNIDYEGMLAGRALKEAILAAGIEELESIQSPLDTKVWALVPSDTGLSTEEIFESHQRASLKRSDSGKRLRFEREVWQAFTLPLSEHCSRYLVFSSPKVERKDLCDSEPPPDDCYKKVEQEDIFPDPDERTFSSVCESIERWAGRNKIDLSQLRYNSSKPVQSNAWLRFGALPVEDLSRIMIPGDIVKKLLS